MKLKIKSVVQKKPPINETLLYWGVVDNPNATPRIVEANLAIVPPEELEFVPVGISNEMVWVFDQEGMATDMTMDDLWSETL